MRFFLLASFSIFIIACGSLDKQALQVNNGDNKERVTTLMGSPDDRQFKGDNEAWQYCQTGAGFGYHDYRVIWFFKGKVTGINSYKSSRPASSCVTDIRQINWEDAPDVTLEVRER